VSFDFAQDDKNENKKNLETKNFASLRLCAIKKNKHWFNNYLPLSAQIFLNLRETKNFAPLLPITIVIVRLKNKSSRNKTFAPLSLCLFAPQKKRL